MEQIVGGEPGAAGYVWESNRRGWIRPGDASSFIPGMIKIDWQKYIPNDDGSMVGENPNPETVVPVIKNPFMSLLPSTTSDGKIMISGFSVTPWVLILIIGAIAFYLGQSMTKNKREVE